MTYYDRQGQEISLMAWADLMENIEYKRVKLTGLGEWFISTVWLGLDHSMCGAMWIFETMIYEMESGRFLGFIERHSTEEEALMVHEQLVRLIELNIYAIRLGGMEEFLEGESEKGSLQAELDRLG